MMFSILLTLDHIVFIHINALGVSAGMGEGEDRGKLDFEQVWPQENLDFLTKRFIQSGIG